MLLMMSPFTVGAKEGWSDEEKGRWAEAAKECLTGNEKRTGTVKVVAWVAVATK
jgi:hypothetical protein